jgi:FkbM family methyltransferase
MRLIKKSSRKAYLIFNYLGNIFKPFIQTKDYLGFKLFYSKGTSLIEMIDKEELVYEPDTCHFLKKLMQGKSNPSFIDIGSNIGMISLYMLRNISNLTIYAFDPGQHQSELFRKTIVANKLNNRIKLFEIALNDKNGESNFCIHNSKHASGDGFKDTGIAGNYEAVTVKTQRLDDWWIENDKPQIDLIKIDTEGAELFILKGAQIVFNTCKPNVYFEMHPSLYKAYDYSHIDIINFFNSINYVMYTLDETIVSATSAKSYLNTHANYYAIPN